MPSATHLQVTTFDEKSMKRHVSAPVRLLHSKLYVKNVHP